MSEKTTTEGNKDRLNTEGSGHLQPVVMFYSGYYGKAVLPSDIFNRLNESYFISGCTDTTKYMCANSKETKHLTDLGVDIDDVICDWYELVKQT